MSRAHVYRILVPDAPLHRRTDRDTFATPEAARRVDATNFLRERAAQPGLQTPRLLSTFSGSIDALLFVWPRYVAGDTRFVAAYRSLIGALRPGTKFVVVHHESIATTVEGWFTGAGHAPADLTMVPLPDFTSLTDWAEDAYVALEDTADGTRYLMEPWEFPRAGDALIADAVEEFTDIRASQAPLIFQGGNCLIGDDFWLLGKDYFADSVQLTQRPRPPVTVPTGVTPEDFVRTLFARNVDAGRTLRIVGTETAIPLSPYYATREGANYFLDIATDGAGTFQPIFHIDMLISLIGRNASNRFEVLVGSPAAADQLLGTSSPFGLASVYDDIASQLTAAGLVVHRNPLVHRPTRGRTFTLAQLREVASQPQGDEALLVAVQELVAAGAGDASPVTIRTWHHITWNNCLVENSASRGKHVYLPTFGHQANADLRPIDTHMKALWEGFGFTVHLLGDFNEFARRQGVVHCIKKYLARGA
jgi:hypothetical protein